jgi:AcrR family transcriptional regulator
MGRKAGSKNADYAQTRRELLDVLATSAIRGADSSLSVQQLATEAGVSRRCATILALATHWLRV